MLVIVALAPATVVAAWLVSGVVTSPLTADTPIEPIVAPAGRMDRIDATSVELTAEYQEPFQITSAAAGVVTHIGVRPGDEISSGDRLISVDDRVVVAYQSDGPLWRDLAIGDRGADVARAQSFLDDLGFPRGNVEGVVTSATVEGIRQFNHSLGRGDDDRVLHLETLAWIGLGALRVAEVHVRLGATVTPGTVLFSGPTELASVSVAEPDTYEDREAEYVLEVGGVVVPYQPGSGRVDDSEALAALDEALRGRNQVVGTVRRAEPVPVATVPVAAVVTDSDGRTCLYQDVDGPPVPIVVVGGSLSVAEVPIDWAGKPVLINPRDVRRDLTCG